MARHQYELSFDYLRMSAFGRKQPLENYFPFRIRAFVQVNSNENSVSGQADFRGEAFLAYGDAIRAAIPNLNHTYEKQFNDGDTIVTRGTTRDTHLGAFGDFPATGNAIEVPWVMITRLKDGRVSAEWEIFDTLAFMTQLEAVSSPPEQE
jgi:predicted ester cyclase